MKSHSRSAASHSSSSDTLFRRALEKPSQGEEARTSVPLAERMRARTLAEYMGQRHLLAEGKFLEQAIRKDRVPSLILWGPPGVGKTTLAKVIANYTKSEFVPFSAVLSSITDLRAIVQAAKERRDYQGMRTTVFVDEIHRFHKGQQDAFLPHVESGVIQLIGASTENPSFAVNAALLSRCKVFKLESLSESDVLALLKSALSDTERGLGGLQLTATDELLTHLAAFAKGDARRALGALEALADLAHLRGESELTLSLFLESEEKRPLLYDKAGDEHYGIISAFIKSMRGSDPDAAVYWMMRMVEAGEDPLFILRRMIIFASEDIGNADPRALLVANSCDEAFRRLGMPEGLYAMGQCVTYLASAPKSNAAQMAWKRAKELVERFGALPVPLKLRPQSTSLNKSMGYGADYRYAHDYEHAYVPGETYLPEEIANARLYEPTERGEEARIKARLEALKALKVIKSPLHDP